MRPVAAAPGTRWERQNRRDGKGQGLDPWEYASLAAISGSRDDKPGSPACLQKNREKQV